MVKPGVYTINKKELKNGDKTTEYVHVEVQPLPPKYDTVVRERKGCTGMRLLGVFLFLLVIVGIAVGITYAVRWEEGCKPELPEGGDVIYDRPDDDYEWEDGNGRPGDHDGHHGDHPIDPTGDGRPDDGDHGRPESTERPPPIDYIGTRPPLIGGPEDGHDDHGHDDDTDDSSEDHDGRPHHGHDNATDDSSEDHDGRPHHGDDDDTDDSSEDHDGRPHHGHDNATDDSSEDHDGRPHHGDDDDTDDSSEDHDGRPHHGHDNATDDSSEDHDDRPHHGDDDDTDDSSEDHDGRPHHGDDDDTDDSSEDHDGRPHHGNDDGEDDDDDKINHRNMNNPPFRSISQWKSERAGREKMVALRRPIQARPAYQGRSRVETKEARYGHDYGHSGKQYRKRA
ncbi:hypothetical protein BSL78_16615 [Apostichopus japonicus]|uniref:Uncharacterized protein n=2 Tax=Stichopus japonicus TaxID=307972 RepID=A0A2G8KEV5_STIJA|nr:hypothetical protein BSL78_16615 [Apostichopus japonicus]